MRVARRDPPSHGAGERPPREPLLQVRRRSANSSRIPETSKAERQGGRVPARVTAAARRGPPVSVALSITYALVRGALACHPLSEGGTVQRVTAGGRGRSAEADRLRRSNVQGKGPCTAATEPEALGGRRP